MFSKRGTLTAAVAVAAAEIFPVPQAYAGSLLTTPEALQLAFPKCETKAETRYLTPEQLKAARAKAGSEPSSAVVIRYVARCSPAEAAPLGEATPGGASRAAPDLLPPSGYAYTDTHRVRTHPETLLVALGGDGKIARIEVLSFDEPPDYLPKPEWYRKFNGQALGPELALKRAIPQVTGASLTSRSTTDAARRILALHEIIGP